MYIGIVAGEPSGDSLGAELVRAIKKEVPKARFIGIGGTKMEQAGVSVLYSMDRISIMGLDGLLGSLWDILKIRRNLVRFFRQNPPDVFVGIDVPDFNTALELKLKRAGIPTVHYVSPTVWAWRGYRIRKIKKAVSHMMTLFPFEADYYRKHKVPVTFVGHPFADKIPLQDQKLKCRQQLGLTPNKFIMAVLPGSRISELQRLGPIFIDTVSRIYAANKKGIFLAPFANEKTKQYFESLVRAQATALPVSCYLGQSREVMAASDIVLLASGTAALEAALLKKPMVVAYRVSPLTELMVRLFSSVKYYSMPNNLLPQPLVPEYLQQDAEVGKLTAALTALMNDTAGKNQLVEEFTRIHQTLKQNASSKAAQVVLNYCIGGRT